MRIASALTNRISRCLSFGTCSSENLRPQRRDVTELADACVAVTWPETHADGRTHVRIGAAREQQLCESRVLGLRRWIGAVILN